jgi:hypothetical protein
MANEMELPKITLQSKQISQNPERSPRNGSQTQTKIMKSHQQNTKAMW